MEVAVRTTISSPCLGWSIAEKNNVKPSLKVTMCHVMILRIPQVLTKMKLNHHSRYRTELVVVIKAGHVLNQTKIYIFCHCVNTESGERTLDISQHGTM